MNEKIRRVYQQTDDNGRKILSLVLRICELVAESTKKGDHSHV